MARHYVKHTTTTKISMQSVLPPAVVPGSPCTNLGVFSNGKVLPKHAKGSGFTIA